MPWGTARELVTTHWWRTVPVVAAMIVATWGHASVFALFPMLLWCAALARTRRTGLIVALTLLALQVWFVAPHVLWWSGPWLPSPLELYWLYPLLTAVVCEVGVVVERGAPAGVLRLLAVVALGFLATAVLWIDQEYVKPKDEGVLPGPTGVSVAEGEGWCGSGQCARRLDVTGDRATEVMRAHLVSRGFTPTSSLGGGERMCRSSGIVMTHEVCAELDRSTASSVRVTWYVNRS